MLINSSPSKQSTTIAMSLAKPRFINPYCLPPSTIPVSRKDVFANEDKNDVDNASWDSHTADLLVGQLNEIIRTSLESNTSLEKEHSDRRKRRKIAPVLQHASINLNDPFCMSCII